ENYDVNDVIAILQSVGYNDQPTKAAPSAASIALQARIAEEAAAAAAEAEAEEAPAEEEAPVEEAAVEETAAEETATEEVPAEETAAEEAPVEETAVEEAPVEETAVEEAPVEETAVEEAPVEEAAVEEEAVVEEEAAVEEEAPAEEAAPAASMLNLDKSGIAADGLTDLQIRLKLVDATVGMEDAVANAVKSVVSGAEKTSYRTATNLEVSTLGYDLSYAGGQIFEFKLGEDYDKAAVEAAVRAALEQGGYSLNAIQFVKYDAAAEAARLAAEAAELEAAVEDGETAEEIEADIEQEEDAAPAEETGTDLRILVDMNDVTSQVRSILEREMTAKYPNFRFISVDHVSAIAGRDLLSNAVKALLIAFVCMLAYIAIRFSPLSGCAALFALVHDILIMCSFMVFFRGLFQVNSPFIAAILTIVGYSINNTIIIFDRIRENRKRPGMSMLPMMDIVEKSVSSTLARTINTTLTTLITLVCLFIFGVSSIKEFAFPLIVGMLAGTYSSVLLSGQVWAMWDAKLAANKRAKSAK
ncbi:MAG: protein translocase subunit SecF, partial [bacterium]